MPRRRPLLFLLMIVPALLVGCSAGTTPSSAPPPAITTNPTPVSTGPTPGPTITDYGAACPSGEYKATSFTATSSDSISGKGTVTDVDATFRNGRYEFEFDDDSPITLTIGTSTRQVRIDGEFRGTYSGASDALTFTLGDTTGTAKATQGGKTQSLPMRDVAAVLAPQGTGKAVCTADKLTITTDTVTWNLVRDLD
ncbi:MAG: hypothetical protein QM619_01235 [Micropruina sp.]|uniref:hypothetical protein n=1 Tax=Micropruina sp. TaxID=2737536 RepID=UPI0039E59FFC